MCSFPGQGTRIWHATQDDQKKKKKNSRILSGFLPSLFVKKKCTVLFLVGEPDLLKKNLNF